MLTGQEIQQRILSGDIVIEDFDLARLNPNSYNLRIGNKIGYYEMQDYCIKYMDEKDPIFFLDSKRKNTLTIRDIPEDGALLLPGTLYLANTMENTYAKDLVPCISGRSSFARLGLQVHQTAGFGDIGVDLRWTLEISVIHPIMIYPGQEICQIYFEEITGTPTMTYSGKYQKSDGIVESRSYMDK